MHPPFKTTHAAAQSLQQVPGHAGDLYVAAGVGYVEPPRCCLDKDAQSYLHTGAEPKSLCTGSTGRVKKLQPDCFPSRKVILLQGDVLQESIKGIFSGILPSRVVSASLVCLYMLLLLDLSWF